MNSTAVITLERLWGRDTSPNNKASVIPFVQGLKNLSEEFDYYYSNIFGTESLREALRELLVPSYKKVIIQIAAHGSGKQISNIRLDTVFKTIAEVVLENGYDGSIGLIMSSCLMGKDKEAIKKGIKKGRIDWYLGYKFCCSWAESTLIDSFLIYSIAKEPCRNDRREKDRWRKKIAGYVENALKLFNHDYFITGDEENGKALKDSITLIVAGDDFRRTPIDYSDQLFK